MRWTKLDALAGCFSRQCRSGCGSRRLACASSARLPRCPASPRFVVVLDAAHGGDDTGGRLANGQLEKTFTLALSVRLRSLLAARGIQVVTTRESDATVDLNRRAEIANHAAGPGLPEPARL